MLPNLAGSSCPRRLRVQRRWVTVFAALLIYVVLFGPLNSYSVLFVALKEEFNSSATTTGWIGAVSIGLSMLLAPVVNLLIERIGCRLVALGGVLVTSAAFIVTSFLSNILVIIFTYGVVVGFGASMVVTSSVDEAMLLFPDQNSVRAMGVVHLGASLGVVAYAPLMGFVISTHGWRVLLRIMGSLLFCVGVPCSLTFFNPPDHAHEPKEDKTKYQGIHEVESGLEEVKRCEHDDVQVCPQEKPVLNLDSKSPIALENTKIVDKQKTDHDHQTKGLSSNQRRGRHIESYNKLETDLSSDQEIHCVDDPCLNGESGCGVAVQCEAAEAMKGMGSNRGLAWKILVALTYPELWLISISTLLNGMGDNFYFTNLFNYMLSVGFQREFGVRVVSVMGFASLVGRLLVTLGGDYVPFPRVFLLVNSGLVGVVVMFVIMFSRNQIIMYCVAIAIGSILATTNIITFVVPAEFFGPERALQTSSVIIFSFGLGHTLGSLMGQSIDTTGSYTSAIWAFIGMYSVSALFVAMSPVYQRFFAPHRLVTFEIYRQKKEARKKNKTTSKKSSKSKNTSESNAIMCDSVTSV